MPRTLENGSSLEIAISRSSPGFLTLEWYRDKKRKI
jgi:hypothetical protein